MVPAFLNVPLNQLNGPLAEHGPQKVGEMEMAAEAADQVVGRGQVELGCHLPRGPERVPVEPWKLDWRLRMSACSLLTLAPLGFGEGENYRWELGTSDPWLLISDTRSSLAVS